MPPSRGVLVPYGTISLLSYAVLVHAYKRSLRHLLHLRKEADQVDVCIDKVRKL